MALTRTKSLRTIGLAVAFSMLAGCGFITGDSGDSGGEKDGGADSGPVETVSLWIPAGGSAQPIQDYLAEWGPENNVDVEVTVQAADQIQETLTLALQTGEGPDLFAGANPTVLQGGLVQPIGDLLSEENQEAYASALEPPNTFHIGGEQFAVPTSATTVRLIYNRGVFEQAGLDPESPPTTLGEVRDACEAIQQEAPPETFCFGLPAQWIGFTQWVVEPIPAAASEDVTQQGMFNRDTEQYEMERLVPVVELYREMIQNEWAFPGASSLNRDPMLAAFSEGQIAMTISPAFDLGVLTGTLKTEQDWAVAPLPVPDDEEKVRSPFQEGAPFLMSATADPEPAGKVLNALIGEELIGRLADDGVIFPIHAGVAEKVSLEGKPAQYEGYLATEDDVAWAPNPSGALQIKGETFKDVLTRLVVTDDPIESTLQATQEQYNTRLQEAVEAGDLDLSRFTG